MPVGPHILCPENARKSQPDLPDIDRHVAGALRGIDERERARRARFAGKARPTGLIVPSEFETWVNANSFTSGVRSSSSWSSARVPSSTDRHESEAGAPARSARSCHGTRLLWCSISVSRITSPVRRNFPPQALRDEIDALGRAAREDDLVRRWRRRGIRRRAARAPS